MVAKGKKWDWGGQPVRAYVNQREFLRPINGLVGMEVVSPERFL